MSLGADSVLTLSRSMEYYHVLIGILEPWTNGRLPERECGIAGPTTLRAIAITARARLETLIRFYYRCHGFERHDALLPIYLLLMGSICARNDGLVSQKVPADPSTFLLCAKGLHDQGRNNYLGVLMFVLLSSLVDPTDGFVLGELAKIRAEFKAAEVRTDLIRMEWPVYPWIHPRNEKMDSLLADLVGPTGGYAGSSADTSPYSKA